MKHGMSLFTVIISVLLIAAAGCSDLGGSSKAGDNLDSPLAYYFFTELTTVGSDSVLQNDYTDGDELNAVAENGATVAEGGKYLDEDTNSDGVADTAHMGVFDGTDDYFQITSLVTGFNADFTVTAWVNADAVDNMPIVSKHTSSGSSDNSTEFYFGIESNKLTLVLGAGSSAVTVASDTSLTTGTWYFVAATVSGTDISLYIDPVDSDDADEIPDVEKTGTFTGTRQSGSEPVRIGYYNNDAGIIYFDGNIDQVRLYGAALDAGSVGFIYESEK